MRNPIQQIVEKKELLAVGLMSGTSMDGVDAALVRMSPDAKQPRVDVEAFCTVPYPDKLQESLRVIAYGEQCTAENIAILHTGVAVAFANAFHTVCRQAGTDSVDFIGSHGQTVAHAPPSASGMSVAAGTLQLGPPGMIAALTGVTTVGDFRVADMALGGQGAPLVPYVDYLLRRSDDKDRVILNIGGIANVTYLRKGGGLDEVIAFDTGPGNMVIDELYRALYPNESGYEKLAESTLAGQASTSLVETFLGHDYFERKPPKSAGHGEFGGAFAWEFLAKAQGAGVSRDDTLASAVTLTTRSIFNAVEKFVRKEGNIDEVFVTGGGLRNAAMMEELKMVLEPATVLPIDELGIGADAKEAVDFAVLARETLFGRYNVIRQATGAARATVLGSIALGGTS